MTERRQTHALDSVEAIRERNIRYAKVAGLALIAFGGSTAGHFIGEALADNNSQSEVHGARLVGDASAMFDIEGKNISPSDVDLSPES